MQSERQTIDRIICMAENSVKHPIFHAN